MTFKYRHIIYNHIPKCAGTLVIDKFSSVFNHARFLHKEMEIEGYEWLKEKLRSDLGSFGTGCHLSSFGLVPGRGSRIEFVSSHTMFDPPIFMHCNRENRYEKNDCDFLFTFIRHPVDRFYSSLYYDLRVMHKVNSDDYTRKRALLSRPIDEVIDMELRRGARYFHKYSDLFLEKHDFVGVAESMQKSFDKLNGIFGTSFMDDRKTNVNPNKEKDDYTYRRDELERHYEKEIGIFLKYKERLDV